MGNRLSVAVELPLVFSESPFSDSLSPTPTALSVNPIPREVMEYAFIALFIVIYSTIVIFLQRDLYKGRARVRLLAKTKRMNIIVTGPTPPSTPYPSRVSQNIVADPQKLAVLCPPSRRPIHSPTRSSIPRLQSIQKFGPSPPRYQLVEQSTKAHATKTPRCQLPRLSLTMPGAREKTLNELHKPSSETGGRKKGPRESTAVDRKVAS